MLNENIKKRFKFFILNVLLLLDIHIKGNLKQLFRENPQIQSHVLLIKYSIEISIVFKPKIYNDYR